MLGPAGLSSAEEQTYRALVAVPHATRQDLSATLPLGESALRAAVARLESLGLAHRMPGRPVRYAAAPPQVALGGLIADQQVRLEQARAVAGSMQEEYRSVHRDRGAAELVEVVTSDGAIGARFEQMLQSAREEVLAFVMPPFLAPGDFEEAEHAQLGRGVAFRTVYDHAGFAAQGDIESMLADIRAGEQARVAAHLPMKLFVVDRGLAFVPMSLADDDRAALLVHPSGLLDALIALFEAVWSRAAPLRLDPLDGDSTELAPAEARLVLLLRAGLTDEAIARQLGWSSRTVHRRIRALLDHTGAETRFQLGCRAVEQGWV